MTRIRLATEQDLDAINEIYNHYVNHSTATFQLDPTTPQERHEWFAAHGQRLPVTVALREDRVIGWAALSTFHPRSAYRFTVEDSVYIHRDFLRKGIGRELLADLLRRADQLGYRAVLAIISADQQPSIRLHTAFGFAEVGRLKAVGYKFNRWLDVIYLQRGTGRR